MAQFRGTVQGNRGEAHRLGHKKEGLRTTAYGWQGGIVVDLHYDDISGRDYATVRMVPGASRAGESYTLYHGPLDQETIDKLGEAKIKARTHPQGQAA